METTHQDGSIMDLIKSNKSKENLNFLLERSLSRKECIKTTNCITKNKSKEEENKKEGDKKSNNKDIMNSNTKEVMKNQPLPQITMKKYGKKSFLNKNLCQDQLQKKQHQAIQYIRWHKIQVKSEVINKEITKNLGGKMLKIKIKRNKMGQKMMKERHS